MKTMKKILSLVIVCSMLCLSACGTSEQPENKSLARTVEVPYGDYSALIEFNEKGLVVAEKNRPDGAHNAYYTYDEENRITEITHAQFEETDYENYEKLVYEYYSDGKVKRLSVYSLPENELERYKEYIYDNGRLEKTNAFQCIYRNGYLETFYSYSYDFRYTQDGDYLIVDSRCISSDGTVGHSTDTYDKDGKIVMEEYSPGYGSTEYIYDEDGNLIEEIFGNDEAKQEYQYDNGVLVKRIWFTKENNTYEKGSYSEYKYYDDGNIVAQYNYETGGGLGEINIDGVDAVKGNYKDLEFYV